MSKVFISYRRDDSSGYAHAIHSRLVQHFSKDQVFMDVDTMEPGVDFVGAIEKAVGECDVLVALIGKRWAGGESSGTSRFDNTKDYVRLEVSTALARDIRVIPVLVDGMTMPNEDSLPSPVQPITRRNAIEISNTRFNYDVDQLITAVRKILDTTEAKRKADEEAERNRLEQEAEHRRFETEEQRKAEEERLREEERKRSEEQARRKAEEERRRIEEERNGGEQEAERHSLEAEAQRKLEEETKRKTDEADRRYIEQEVPSPWRTYGPVAAAVAVVLILFSFVFWWPKREEPKQEEPKRVEVRPASKMTDLQLPGGMKVTVPEGSFIQHLQQWLSSTTDTTVPRRFVFDNLNFETGSTKLTPDSIPTINSLVSILKAYPAVTVRLEGHTDNTDDAAANKKLSLDRAVTLKEIMITGGIAGGRIRTNGYGEEKPIAPNETEEGRAKNRRTELVVEKR
jgi:outer membrane protein OmpA-like peptidoglycan-associated protein